MTDSPSNLLKATDAARRTEKLAEQWKKGLPDKEAKEEASKLFQEIREIYSGRQDPERNEVINSTKATRLLLEALRTAAFSRGALRGQLTEIVTLCIAHSREATLDIG